MPINFENISYLKQGNTRQKAAYKAIKALNIINTLQQFNPILTGTIPIEIDIPNSDLDIICYCKNHEYLQEVLIYNFKDETDFEINTIIQNKVKSTIATFKFDGFVFEIFGQNTPTKKQNAYKHMLIEYDILQQKGTSFKNTIIALKLQGLKTEPAFAKALHLPRNPYETLLAFKF